MMFRTHGQGELGRENIITTHEYLNPRYQRLFTQIPVKILVFWLKILFLRNIYVNIILKDVVFALKLVKEVMCD